MPSFESELSDEEIEARRRLRRGRVRRERQRRRDVRAGRDRARGLRHRREHVSRAGVRQHRPRGRREGGDRRAREEDGERRRGARRLPSHRPLDRRGDTGPARRERREGVRGGLRRLRVGLLPRAHRAGVRRRPGRGARPSGRRQPDLRGRGDPARGLRLVPVRPRPRARADAAHGLRPAEVSPRLRRAEGGVRPGLVHRRRLHGERERLLRHHLEVAEGRRPHLSLQRGRHATQVLLLPARDVADPAGRGRQPRAHGRGVPPERGRLGRGVLRVVRPGRLGHREAERRADPAAVPAGGRERDRLHLRRRARHREQRRGRRARRPLLRARAGERPRALLRGRRHDPRRAAHVRRRAARGLRGADDALSRRLHARRRVPG